MISRPEEQGAKDSTTTLWLEMEDKTTTNTRAQEQAAQDSTTTPTNQQRWET